MWEGEARCHNRNPEYRTFLPWNVLRISRFTRSVKKSPTMVFTPGIGLIGIKSTPTMVDAMVMVFCAICSHPPGAAPKSKRVLQGSRDFAWTTTVW